LCKEVNNGERMIKRPPNILSSKNNNYNISKLNNPHPKSFNQVSQEFSSLVLMAMLDLRFVWLSFSMGAIRSGVLSEINRIQKRWLKL